jgi:type IV pilus assembly protein PilP
MNVRTQDRTKRLAPAYRAPAFGTDSRRPGPTLSRAASGVTLAALCLGMAGCSDDRMDDLYAFVQQAKSRQTPKIEPLPAIRTFETFAYAATTVRDPFVPPEEPEHDPKAVENPGNGISPNFDRPREELERFSLDGLRMVGTLAQEQTVYGIVLAPGGNVYRVQPDNYIGKNHGRITTIGEDRIVLTEIVSDGADGWEKRLAALALSE